MEIDMLDETLEADPQLQQQLDEEEQQQCAEWQEMESVNKIHVFRLRVLISQKREDLLREIKAHKKLLGEKTYFNSVAIIAIKDEIETLTFVLNILEKDGASLGEDYDK
tara:strand:- start:357 stop:683 length:327 start_codon:yes stop_codon:yes gene_type:complete